jgi:flagellar biosynthesis chaperone FliJ
MLQQLKDKLAVTTSRAVAEQLEMQIRALESHIAELERAAPR